MEKLYDDYINGIKALKKKKYIYGAGRVGQALYGICLENDIDIEAFLVTNAEQNPTEVQGKQVMKFDETVDADALILLGVLEHGESEIKKYIKKIGEYQVLDCPEQILYTIPFYKRKRQAPTMEITPIIGCAVNCKYCPQKLLLREYFKDNKNRKSYMTLEDFKVCIDKLPKDTVIEWAGFAEPFLNRECIDMMLYANEKGYDMTLFTTMVGLSEENLERILKIPFKQVVLHTADKDGYANIAVTEEYLRLLEKIVEAKKQNGNPWVDKANCQSEPHEKVLEKLKGRLRIYCEMSDRAGNLDNTENNLKTGEKTGRIYCERANNMNHNVLLPDGTVVLCCNDFGMQHVLGNLLEDDYEQLMNSEMMRHIKRGMHIDETLPLLCRKCIYANNI